ncbi:MAG: alpha/beta hydrolase [Rhodospirillaceae bacterium]|nr:alpha/beta hydrolase [Rhodospirillaceae bacterium]MYB14970.1 alpha/beta hydrolase [Rhodospirillaceae bacterium]MYI47591.1 alpha/beta hydrolase [Rhodospirillaceae bacterium]
MPLVDCAGRTVNYEAGGPDDGTAPLMPFQPPGASGAPIWRSIAAALQDRFRTAAVNPSAYGETEAFAGPEPMTLRDEAAALAAVIRAELPKCRGKRAHIVGHSYGGTIALVLALAWPELTGRLTLLEPAPYVLLRDAGETALADEIGGQNAQFIATVRAGSRNAEAMEQYLDYFNNRPGFWQGLDGRSQQKMLTLAERLAVGLDAVERLDMRVADLAAIDVPVTVVRGGDTDPLHARLSELVAQAIPGATLIDLPGAGHMMTLTHGAEIAGMLRETACSDQLG